MLALPKLHLEKLLQEQFFRGLERLRVVHEEPSRLRMDWSIKSLDDARTRLSPERATRPRETLRRAELLPGVRRAEWMPDGNRRGLQRAVLVRANDGVRGGAGAAVWPCRGAALFVPELPGGV
jgi:hypothetical protein